ncbi:carbohydrate porin [Singulisphaera sp. PoT]|uniref:carbohydrate porin n=1 Tax=Singulisphaera sp. PoT TaxID=3411797 RepID=UPI003BF5D4AF
MATPWILVFAMALAGDQGDRNAPTIPPPATTGAPMPAALAFEMADDLPPLPQPGAGDPSAPFPAQPQPQPQPAAAGGDAASPNAETAGGAARPGDATDSRGRQAISGNPAAVNIVAGTGALGRFFGIGADTGVRLGGLWIGDASGVVSGGSQPGRWGLNSLTVIDLNLDGEKIMDWKGGMVGAEFLQFAGQPTNSLAGAFPGFDSIPVTPPFIRQELYQLWVRQSFFDDKLIVRAGKTVPTFDFNNVVRPVPVDDPAAGIPAVSGLAYTPIFVNPTLLGAIPGYYNSAVGITTTFAPTKQLYFSYGAYDSNVSLHQTGLQGPRFDGHYFHIGEVGYSYRIGRDKKPGSFGIGGWGLTGDLQDFNKQPVKGTGGMYLFGSQRLWFRNPGLDNSGLSGFYQFGANNSNFMIARQFFGAGLTAFGLVPGRPADSFGAGLALTWLNPQPGASAALFPATAIDGQPLRPSQLMMSAYYQFKIFDGWFFQPNLTYIPTPAENAFTPSALAVTLRLTVLF